MKVTLSNPAGMKVILENRGKCKDPRCSKKTLYWAKNPTTQKAMLISHLIAENIFIQHFKDCESRNTFSAGNPKYKNPKPITSSLLPNENNT